MLVRCQMDPSIIPVQMGDMRFPAGVYPVESMTPIQGYAKLFEPADGDDEAGEWEEWPDRYVYDIVISAERLPALVRSLLGLFPPRLYPILDVIGHDAYREIDPFISYDLIGLDRFLDTLRRYRDYFFEDGMCGFGAMCDDPFVYLFVDEHKVVTIRCTTEDGPRFERVLAAFDLQEVPEPAGPDAAAHEHRSVLHTPDENPDLLSEDEVLEALRDDWRLVLNIDPEDNVDDDGKPLGTTAWRCLVRLVGPGDTPRRYAEVLLYADSLADAEELAAEAVLAEAEEPREPTPRSGPAAPRAGKRRQPAPAAADPEPLPFDFDADVVHADRLTALQLGEMLKPQRTPSATPGRIVRMVWSE